VSVSCNLGDIPEDCRDKCEKFKVKPSNQTNDEFEQLKDQCPYVTSRHKADPEVKSDNSGVIIGCCIGGAALLIIIVVCYLVCCRKRDEGPKESVYVNDELNGGGSNVEGGTPKQSDRTATPATTPGTKTKGTLQTNIEGLKTEVLPETKTAADLTCDGGALGANGANGTYGAQGSKVNDVVIASNEAKKNDIIPILNPYPADHQVNNPSDAPPLPK
ncbi:hypothetical protein PFISCL1PPCAC_4543, partial [Pristionchus fissidentatus]